MKLKKFISFVIVSILFSCNFAFPQAKQNVFGLNEEEHYYCDTFYDQSGSGNTTVTSPLEYDHYEMDDVHLERFCPLYTAINHVNNCAPAAGTIVVGYHDYTCVDLIPDYTPGIYYGGMFFNYPQNYKVDNVQESLYTLMGTNTIQPGTSISQFQTGLTSYVTSKNYSISYSSCGSSFAISTAVGHLNNGLPIALFMYGFVYYPDVGFFIGDNGYSLVGRSNPNGHVAVIFGYRQYRFYDSNDELIETDNFLIVSYGDATQGFIDMGQTTIDAGYAISIS